jgi:hypothetical protein
MTAKIQVRRDTTTNWNAGTPPTLDVGEIGLDTTLKQIKIGDGSSNWTALPWLGGTLPSFTSPSSIDLNDVSNRVTGLYRFADGSLLNNGPLTPINMVSDDGGATMLVVSCDSHVVQQLWADGNGTQPVKSYSRVYDHGATAWRDWAPQNSWAVSATEGVDLTAKSITLKDTGTGLTVDGNSTLTGNITVNGTTTLGDDNADIVTFQAGTVTDPIITTTGDTDTGIYFPAADSLAVATAGIQAMLVGPSQGVTFQGNISVNGTLSGDLDCGSNKLTNISAPTATTDAMRLDDLVQKQRIVFFYTTSDGAGQTGSDGIIQWTVNGIGSSSAQAQTTTGQWRGIVVGISGGGNIQSVSVKKTNTQTMSVSGGTITGLFFWAYRSGT